MNLAMNEAPKSAVEVDVTPVPLRDYVIIQPEGAQETEGGLILPDSVEKKWAVVVASGPGHYDTGVFIPNELKPGTRVFLDAPQGTIGEFEWHGVKYAITRECFVCAILPGPAEMARRIKVPELKLQ